MRVVLIVALCASLGGCSASYLAGPTAGNDRVSFQSVNASVGKDNVIVLLRDGTECPGRLFSVDSAFVTWHDIRTGEASVRPLASVRGVRTDARSGNAIFTGAMGGLAVGVVVGAKIGSTTMTGEDRQLGATIGVAVGGAGGALVGAGIGAATSRSIEFVFSEPDR